METASCSCKTCPNAAVVLQLQQELNAQKKQLFELKSAIENLIENKFLNERKFIFGKVSDFGKHIEKRLKDEKKEILHEVDVKVYELKNKIDDRLLDQTDDLKDLEEDTELKFEELTLKAEAEALLIKKLKLGPYANKFAQLQHTDASHGKLLQNMIQDEVNPEILSAYVSFMRPDAVKWINPENKNMDALMVCYSLENGQIASFMESYCDDEFVKSHEWMKAMGPYFKLFMKLKRSDAAHGKLLHKMIEDNVSRGVLSAYLPHMRPGAIIWRSPTSNSLNALQIVYGKLDDKLISLMESHCNEDMLLEFADDKEQYASDACIVGSYWNELFESTIRNPNVNEQGRLLHKASANKASKDIIDLMRERMCDDVENYKNDKGMNLLHTATGNGAIYYDYVQTPQKIEPGVMQNPYFLPQPMMMMYQQPYYPPHHEQQQQPMPDTVNQQSEVPMSTQHRELLQELGAAPQEQHTQILGNALFPLVQNACGDNNRTAEAHKAPKITGMLLEMDEADILELFSNSIQLQGKVNDAIEVLETNVVDVSSVSESNQHNELLQKLVAAPEEQHTQILGNALFPLVQNLCGDNHRASDAHRAPKITGMLLEMDESDILELFCNPSKLQVKVNDAIEVLEAHELEIIPDAVPQQIGSVHVPSMSESQYNELLQKLVAAPQEQHNQVLGTALLPLVQNLCGDNNRTAEAHKAPKITGMLLELDEADILELISNSTKLQGKVNEAIEVLEAHRAEA